ncbi:MAG: RNA 2',3'-cyclic phosphodiesterase [Elusimicrobiota bacterium]
MRLFIAVPISEPLRASASRVIAGFSRRGLDFKWTAPENLHLTLSFLGETSPARLPEVKSAMRAAAQGPEPFDLAFLGLGCFEHRAKRVLWMGATQGAERLGELALSLNRKFLALGLLPAGESARPFKAHLTLGRQRSPLDPQAFEEAMKDEAPGARVHNRVDRIILFESRLSSAGPAHTELLSFRLGPGL